MLCVYWVGVPERGEKPIRNFHRKWIPIRWRPTLPAAPGNLHGDESHKAKLAGDPKYSAYAARWNKDVRDTANFTMRQGLYHAANEIIEE